MTEKDKEINELRIEVADLKAKIQEYEDLLGRLLHSTTENAQNNLVDGR